MNYYQARSVHNAHKHNYAYSVPCTAHLQFCTQICIRIPAVIAMQHSSYFDAVDYDGRVINFELELNRWESNTKCMYNVSVMILVYCIFLSFLLCGVKSRMTFYVQRFKHANPLILYVIFGTSTLISYRRTLTINQHQFTKNWISKIENSYWLQDVHYTARNAHASIQSEI